ncbi:MAG TPA: protein kinase [Planctomycetota bacterium]
MSAPTGSAESDSAVRLFLEWVEEHGAARGPAFEALCASHPEKRARLEEIGNLHEHARALLEDPAEPVPDDEAAAALAGTRYEPRGILARGGMGTIVEAHDPHLHRTIAVKVLRPRVEERSCEELERHRSRLAAEAQLLAQLDHPGIVPLYESGANADGDPYFTMKRVDGVDFLAVIRAHRAGEGAWRLPRAIGILRAVAEAVGYAHGKGVIHRDLKPANVMVGTFGEVFVMDWGLAKVVGREAPAGAPHPAVQTGRTRTPTTETEHGTVLGTLEYMAPEQAAGELEALDARTDVYAIGAMLYHVLAGRPPHAAVARSKDLRPGVAERLARIAPGAPEELAAICEKAMAYRAEARYPSALELARELEAWLEGRVVRAHRTGAWVELEKWVGRNRGAAAAAALLLLGLGATAAVQSVLRGELAQQADALRREDTLNRVALASAALGSGDLAHVRELLEGCPGDLRGWEWHYLARAADTSARTFAVQDLELNDVRFLGPNLLLVAGTGAPTRVELRETADGRLRRTLPLPAGHAINSVALSADGARLAAFGYLGELTLWDTQDWQELGRLPVALHGWQGVAFAPAGRRLAAFGTEGVELWDADTRARLAVLSAGQEDIADVAWTPDGARLAASAWDGSLSLWDVEAARLIEVLRVSEARLQRLAWSPDGRWLAAGDWDSRVHVWDARTLQRVHLSDRMGGYVLALDWSPDSTLLAVGGHGIVIELLQAGTWERIGRLVGHTASVRALDFAPDGRTLASASALGNVRLWDLTQADWRSEHRSGSQQTPAGVAFSPDGAEVAVGWSEGELEIWDARARALARRSGLPGRIRHLDWAHGAPRLAATGWDRDILVLDASLAGTPLRLEVEAPTEAHFDPSGTLLAATAQDGLVRMWDLQSGNLVWAEGTPPARSDWPGDLFGASWSPTGDELVTCSQDGRIQVRDAFTGRLRRETVRPRMLFAQFCEEGVHVLTWAYVANQGMELLDAATLAPLWQSPRTNHRWPVLAPDCTRVFSANWQGTLGVWDARSGRPVAEIDALPPGNPRLGVSPDGGCVVLAVGGRLSFLDARVRP